jgi:transposase
VKHVQRAQIILLSAERLPVLEIANRIGVSRPMVWRWQQRFAEEGIEGLLRDKTRPPGIPPVPQAKVHAVVERTLRPLLEKRFALFASLDEVVKLSNNESLIHFPATPKKVNDRAVAMFTAGSGSQPGRRQA